MNTPANNTRSPRVVIFNDTHGWHSDQLCRALLSRGLEPVLSDLAACRIDFASPAGIKIPGFDRQLPDAAIVRGIAPGSLEQITLRMDVLHTLAEHQVPVFNPASAIELTVDKARTSLRLHNAGLPTPATWAVEDWHQAEQVTVEALSLGQSLICKPLFGCQGKGLYKIDSLADFKKIRPVGEAWYLQQFVAPQQAEYWQDWRLLVIGDQVVAAMSRQSRHWITNFAQGAQCFAATVTPEMAELAIRATRCVEASYAGVDLIRTAAGEFSILEVNSVPAWKGLFQATGIDVATHIAEMLANASRQSLQINAV